MKKLSVSITEEQIDRLDDRQDDGDAKSRSDAVRQILDEYEQASLTERIKWKFTGVPVDGDD